MSCRCNLGRELSTPLTSAFIVLTKNDLYKIRTGRMIQMHYHGNNLEKGRITFFVTDEKNKVLRGSKLAKLAMELGDAVPVAISKSDMTEMQNGRVMAFTVEKTPPVEVHVMSAQTYHKIVTKKNAEAEKKLEQDNPDHRAHVMDFLKFARWEIVQKYDQGRTK